MVVALLYQTKMADGRQGAAKFAVDFLMKMKFNFSFFPERNLISKY